MLLQKTIASLSFSNGRPDKHEMAELCSTLGLVVSQLVFVEGFIDDMLNIQIIRDGEQFTLEQKIF